MGRRLVFQTVGPADRLLMQKPEDTMETTQTEGLVFMTDLSGFSRLTRSMGLMDLAALLKDFAAITWKHIGAHQGTIIKYLGDSALGYFTADRVDEGVQALMDMKRDIETNLSIDGKQAKIRIGAHYGPFVLTSLEPIDQADIFGETVNIATMLGSGGQSSHRERMILTPEAFRKLSPQMRKAFHKFTEPVVYLAEL
jgi:adenylate cyclase